MKNSVALFVTFFSLLIMFQPSAAQAPKDSAVIVGADQIAALVSRVSDKDVALVVNHTALVGKTHLADTLKSIGVTIKKVFAPEHGFRGDADAGEVIKDGYDNKSGLKVISLYGDNKKPKAEDLADVDVVIFDIQDVGVRFYTYISTLHYVMDACAENGKKLIILDRPNPNGNYIDGPVLKPALKSFVGKHPIPIVHGLTVAELARMINGQGWLGNGKQCTLDIIKVKNWKHSDPYTIKVKPSPNHPNDLSIKLYPSLFLFEGTVISVGRGTLMPFQIYGHPDLKNLPFRFSPKSIIGMAKQPPYENQICTGVDLRKVKPEARLNLKYLIEMYDAYPEKDKFFNNSFDKLAGTPELQQQIKDRVPEDQIRHSWQNDLTNYKIMRAKYLLYPEK